MRSDLFFFFFFVFFCFFVFFLNFIIIDCDKTLYIPPGRNSIYLLITQTETFLKGAGMGWGWWGRVGGGED